jgi:hypothetical protein
MSKHPHNGPTFTKAPPKKRKPLTDEELASLQARQQAALDETKRTAAKSRQFNQQVTKVGLYQALFPKKD